MKKTWITLFALLFVLPAAAQEFNLGADLMSRYVWRGTDFGDSFSIQPTLAFSQGGLEVGTWASYAVSPEAADVNEHDLWIGYGIETASGTFGFGVTDYYFPNAGIQFFDFSDNGEGAHWIEPYLSYTGPASFPVSLYAGYFVYNDPDNSLYLEASIPFKVDGVDLAFTTGASGGQSALYGTDKFGIVQVALAASKSVKLTEQFALPLSVSYIVNPYMEKSYLVFGVSF